MRLHLVSHSFGPNDKFIFKVRYENSWWRKLFRLNEHIIDYIGCNTIWRRLDTYERTDVTLDEIFSAWFEWLNDKTDFEAYLKREKKKETNIAQ